LNWLRLFEVVCFIIVWIGIFAFLNYTIVKKYTLSDIEMYPVYIVWAVGMILMFVMRNYRKKECFRFLNKRVRFLKKNVPFSVIVSFYSGGIGRWIL